MEKFAGYGFNKSHSAAYALVSYQTLWLKAHYPAAFMAAVLSSDMDSTRFRCLQCQAASAAGGAAQRHWPRRAVRARARFRADRPILGR
jgi:hypothetical protein